MPKVLCVKLLLKREHKQHIHIHKQIVMLACMHMEVTMLERKLLYGQSKMNIEKQCKRS